jgi:hypothetical protein
MLKSVRPSVKIILAILSFLFVVIAVILSYSHFVGLFIFDNNNAVSIFGSIIQGMSALLAVAMAVIVFRIQSLENRNFSVEQSTLNYIYNSVGWSYPEWTQSVENDIKNRLITNRYYKKRVNYWMKRGHVLIAEEERQLTEECNIQQQRLEEALDRHVRIDQTIKRIHDGIISSLITLTSPIIISFFMLMMSDFLDSFQNFLFIALSIVLSAVGTLLMVNIILESAVQEKQ